MVMEKKLNLFSGARLFVPTLCLVLVMLLASCNKQQVTYSIPKDAVGVATVNVNNIATKLDFEKLEKMFFSRILSLK